jgi:hypothetical protein
MGETRPRRTGWSRPELHVLVRGCPEERVLSSCKGANPIIGPQTSYVYCLVPTCGANCNARGAS